jgi:hypothetical protein
MVVSFETIVSEYVIGCGDGNPFNLHVEVGCNQHKMLRTGIEPKALCLLERSILVHDRAVPLPNEHRRTSFFI